MKKKSRAKHLRKKRRQKEQELNDRRVKESKGNS